ncbi:hypothetical protein HERIO_2148 [Hepatospora eriocheir]|uniref:Uncharacterized protein n=1 Tax=Hepatospora eriocheir TaxID=1081669 RepID=A0A1X0Q7X6_9MICR|nr:hypothetical protein HERIO_2148 [Hepatospora eriocheir]
MINDFKMINPEFRHLKKISHEIQLKYNEPMQLKAYSLPYAVLPELKKKFLNYSDMEFLDLLSLYILHQVLSFKRLMVRSD